MQTSAYKKLGTSFKLRIHINIFPFVLLFQVADGDEEDIDGEDEESAGVLDDETDEYDGTSPEAGGAILNPNLEVSSVGIS